MFEGFSYSDLLVGILIFVFGIFVNKVLSRRGIFKYQVFHNHIGLTANDNIFGNVRVTWNEQEFDALWLSKIELTNTSSKDYKDVEVKLFGGEGTFLLTERTQIANTIDGLEHTDSYKYKTRFNEDATDEEKKAALEFFMLQRHYNVPVFNRNQKITFEVLVNVQKNPQNMGSPYVGVSVQHEGVRTKQIVQAPTVTQIWSIPLHEAIWVGLPVSTVLVYLLMAVFGYSGWTLWGSFAVGLLAQLPGIFILKAYRKIADLIKG